MIAAILVFFVALYLVFEWFFPFRLPPDDDDFHDSSSS
jgi:hypothetical protein